MTPKEKAAELVDSFYQTTPNECFVNEPIGIAGRYKAWNQSKQCALIAVDEILYITEHESPSTYVYYVKVKQEIENL